jgi:hypothetical protein
MRGEGHGHSHKFAYKFAFKPFKTNITDCPRVFRIDKKNKKNFILIFGNFLLVFYFNFFLKFEGTGRRCLKILSQHSHYN